MILVLEDNQERIDRFQLVVRALDPSLQLLVWRSARSMILELNQYLSAAKLISLDHDLDPIEDGSDPGDGLEVVKYLVQQLPRRPVIVHSSNGQRSLAMCGELELAGWRFRQVAPIGDDWIETDWRLAARALLQRGRKKAR
jgi:hypothetical protein